MASVDVKEAKEKIWLVWHEKMEMDEEENEDEQKVEEEEEVKTVKRSCESGKQMSQKLA